MLRTKLLILTVVALTTQLSMVSEAQAGPLLDWLKGIRRNCAKPALPQYGYSAPAAQTPNVANLQPGQCLKTCQQTCSRTVVNYVPYTAYRTNWNRVPVTQYRPVTSSDPCTGCTMTCMKPCTTYTYKMQRVPYTTYRPVYRQETYKVPVTTLVNDCNTGSCGQAAPCNTCGTGNVGAMQNFAPQQPTYSAPVYSPGNGGMLPADTVPTLAPTQGSSLRTPIPSGTLSTDANYQLQSAYQNTPAYSAQPQSPMNMSPHTAARVPDVNSATRGVRPQTNQRPFLDRLQNQGSNEAYQSKLKQAKATPAQIKPKTQLTSLHRRWSYSPVRLASNRSESKGPSSFSSVETREQINSAWDDVK